MTDKLVKSREPINPPKVGWIKISENLNEAGYFFQQNILHRLREACGLKPFFIEEEVPFAFPKQENLLPGNSGRCDIFSTIPAHNRENGFARLIIECKRASRNRKLWVGLHASTRHRPMFQVENGQLIDGDEIPGLRRAIEDLTLVGDMIEVKTEGGEVAESGKPIGAYKAAYQVAHAYAGLHTFSPPGNACKWTVPIIATTAPLFTADYDPGDVDKTTGHLNCDKIKYTPKDSLIWDFPLPAHLQVGKGKHVTDSWWRSILVVNTVGFEKLISRIRDIP